MAGVDLRRNLPDPLDTPACGSGSLRDVRLIAPETKSPNLRILRAQIEDLRETHEEFTIQALPWDQTLSQILAEEFPELVGTADDALTWDGLWDGLPPSSSLEETISRCEEGASPSVRNDPEPPPVVVARQELEELLSLLDQVQALVTGLLHETA